MFNLYNRKGAVPDTSRRAADSLMLLNNKTIQSRCKWIKVDGVKGTDTLSVYNQDGILAAGLFNNKKVYTCEMAIDIKYLAPANITTNFFYHIRINGKDMGNASVIVQNMDGTPATGLAAESIMASFNRTNNEMFAPTDFWGEYTLVK